MIDSAVMLLPQPDSPTTPSVWPSSIAKVTPSTALTTPSWVKKWVRRPLTSSRSSVRGRSVSPVEWQLDAHVSLDALAGIERVAQAVAEEAGRTGR